MEKIIKNVLIFGATSSMACELIPRLLEDNTHIYAISRKELNITHSNLFKFNLDLTKDDEIDSIFEKLKDITFDVILNFQGVAICSPVECLDRIELQKQFDISVFSLVRILNNLRGKINKNGIFLNVSSMASYGIFPFLSPYSMAKASSDILLNCFEIETGIKTVSIKPGVVGTKFWKFCVDENSCNFNKMQGDYKLIGEFLIDNALKNSNKGISPKKVSDLIYKIIYTKNPKSSYNIGVDSYFARFVSYFKGRLIFNLIRKILNKKVKRFKNER